MSGSPGPLRAVLAAFGAGARSLAEVCERTGLERDVVSAAVAHLIRAGHLRAEQLSTGCPDGGCGSCGSDTSGACASSDVGSGGPSGHHPAPFGSGRATGRGPVLVTLARSAREATGLPAGHGVHGPGPAGVPEVGRRDQ